MSKVVQSTDRKDELQNKIPVSGIQKSPTGLKGFDEITYGGIPKYRPTILVGSSGTGKTFMSLEYIINGALMYDEPGVFMTFEEKTEELQENVRTLGYDLTQLVNEKNSFSSILLLAVMKCMKWASIISKGFLCVWKEPLIK